jgi:iron-sulfur cluster assembly accessory protein
MITVTKEAIEKLKETLDYPKNDIIRIFVSGAGWGSPNYGMALDESIEEYDKEVVVEGIRFIYNEGLAHYIEGLEIGYRNTMLGDRFSVSHPGATSC